MWHLWLPKRAVGDLESNTRSADHRMRPSYVRAGLLAALAGMGVVLALAGGCESQAARPMGAVPGKPATILFSADNQGVLNACGCPSDPSGGFAKRQTVIEDFLHIRPNVLVVDAGDMFRDRPNTQKVKYLCMAIERAKYDAIAAGDQEFQLGVAPLQALARQYKLPLICANVCDEAGQPVFPPHVIRQAGDLRIGIFAVVAEDAKSAASLDWRKGLKIEPPLEAARREVHDLAGCDVIVALSHQSLEASQDMARKVPGIHVIVSGHDETRLNKPLKVEGTTIVSTGAAGRVVGALAISREPTGALTMTMELTGLNPRVKDSKWVTDLYWQYVKNAKNEPIPVWELTPVPDAYESAEACSKCHQREYDQWISTQHAHAYATLEHTGRQDDPECILCHTMGYGRDGGFISNNKTPELARVTCQACHPITGAHGRAGAPKDPKVPAKDNISQRVCIGCHGLVESPKFDYTVYKPKIAHLAAADEKK
jgi:2',3'-cyclic-nucleotide 2'-phosphodiesterase (5'-nucleotidase family)